MIPPDEPRVNQVSISAADAGLRLDLYLARRFTYLARHAWARQIAEGRVRVNGVIVLASKRLRTGDLLRYTPEDTPEPLVDPTWSLIAEGDDWLAVNKSGNLPCHPGGRFLRHTLWWLLRAALGHEPHLIHRLDRETSGVVLVARDGAAAAHWQRLWASGQVHKDYLAIVRGEFPDTVQADGFLSPDPASPVRKQRRYTPHDPGDGESASTAFRCLARGDSASLVLCQPRTGRLHQLRATLLSLGYPILGDKLYGGDPTRFLDFIAGAPPPTTDGIARQALHAWRLTLPDGRALLAPLSPDFTTLANVHKLPLPVG